MGRQILKRHTDYNVRVIAPIDVDNQTVLNDAVGASSTFKVYDPAKDESFTAFEPAGQTVLSVTNAGIFELNDINEATQDDGSLHVSVVNNIDAALNEITISIATARDCVVGARIRVVLDSGTPIPMPEFGQADINTDDWGYTGILSDTHAAHDSQLTKTPEGFDIDIEISFDGGTGLAVKDTQCATIKEDECE